MSKPAYGPNPTPPSEGIFAVFESIARFLMGAGALATVGSLGFLIYTYITFAGGQTPAGAEQALSNIGILGTVLLVGVLAVGAGTTFIYWGEEILGALQLIFAAALFFAPFYIPTMLGGQAPGEVGGRALQVISTAGMVFGILAIATLSADVATRVRQRALVGARAEQLRYGKGIKEEPDKQNVFLGKCWQLPFCRKYVRERCPIYHAKRTCWRERVGCMCEEQVIRDAMANKVIPKNDVEAAKFIPYNTKLPMAQKVERCRSCVIYNEHQKHKYKLALPGVVLGFAAVYLLFREPLLAGVGGLIQGLDRVFGRMTFNPDAGMTNRITQSGIPFQEILLVCLMIVAFAYALKALEFLIFKLKI